jgi:hypothetical protein
MDTFFRDLAMPATGCSERARQSTPLPRGIRAECRERGRSPEAAKSEETNAPERPDRRLAPDETRPEHA